MASIAPPAHTRGRHTTDDWITPKWLIERLGLFDLDVCASYTQPWPCARVQYTPDDNGMAQPWHGCVWMNPPYGKQTAVWLERLAAHGSGVALVFARTETAMFFRWVRPKASAVLFLRGRLTFHYPDGQASKAGHNSGGPSCLIGYGAAGRDRLERVPDLGALVMLRS